MNSTFEKLMEAYEDGRISRRRLLLTLPALMIGRRAVSQTTNRSIPVKGINQVTLSVSDVKRSVDFYQGLFGMPVISRQGPAVNLQIGAGPQFLAVKPAGTTPPSISQLGFGVDNFDADRIVTVLAEHGVAKSETGGPMTVRVSMRGAAAGGDKDATTEIHVSDPDGIVVQLQDARYCGGAGRFGIVCPAPQAAPKKGLLALRDWSHTTNFVSDAARSHKFYQEVFGLQIQAYQGPAAPVIGVGDGVHFVMFAGGGGGARGARGGANAAPRPGGINHLCMSMDNFQPDAVTKALESYGIKPRGTPAGAGAPLVHYISMRMENRGGAKEGTPELYFTDPDGLLIQLQDVKYCGGGGFLGDICL